MAKNSRRKKPQEDESAATAAAAAAAARERESGEGEFQSLRERERERQEDRLLAGSLVCVHFLCVWCKIQIHNWGTFSNCFQIF
jgi:hypothetical protein